jgi:hypothetical protein
VNLDVELRSRGLNSNAKADTCVQWRLVKSLKSRRDCGTRLLIPIQQHRHAFRKCTRFGIGALHDSILQSTQAIRDSADMMQDVFGKVTLNDSSKRGFHSEKIPSIMSVKADIDGSESSKKAQPVAGRPVTDSETMDNILKRHWAGHAEYESKDFADRSGHSKDLGHSDTHFDQLPLRFR